MKTLEELKRDGWIFVANYADCLIMAKGDKRLLWNPLTCRVLFRYNVKGAM